MANDEQAVVMNVPKDVIETHIKLAVSQVLARDPERLIRACVDAVLTQKDRNNYRDKTILDTMLEKLIIDTANLAAVEWIREQGPMIREAVRARLTKDRAAFIKKLCDAIGDNLQKNVHVSVSLTDKS